MLMRAQDASSMAAVGGKCSCSPMVRERQDRFGRAGDSEKDIVGS